MKGLIQANITFIYFYFIDYLDFAFVNIMSVNFFYFYFLNLIFQIVSKGAILINKGIDEKIKIGLYTC
jgi:hypothetical protein